MCVHKQHWFAQLLFNHIICTHISNLQNIYAFKVYSILYPNPACCRLVHSNSVRFSSYLGLYCQCLWWCSKIKPINLLDKLQGLVTGCTDISWDIRKNLNSFGVIRSYKNAIFRLSYFSNGDNFPSISWPRLPRNSSKIY